MLAALENPELYIQPIPLEDGWRGDEQSPPCLPGAGGHVWVSPWDLAAMVGEDFPHADADHCGPDVLDGRAVYSVEMCVRCGAAQWLHVLFLSEENGLELRCAGVSRRPGHFRWALLEIRMALAGALYDMVLDRADDVAGYMARRDADAAMDEYALPNSVALAYDECVALGVESDPDCDYMRAWRMLGKPALNGDVLYYIDWDESMDESHYDPAVYILAAELGLYDTLRVPGWAMESFPTNRKLWARHPAEVRGWLYLWEEAREELTDRWIAVRRDLEE